MAILTREAALSLKASHGKDANATSSMIPDDLSSRQQPLPAAGGCYSQEYLSIPMFPPFPKSV